jgi:hypothetical protein
LVQNDFTAGLGRRAPLTQRTPTPAVHRSRLCGSG